MYFKVKISLHFRPMNSTLPKGEINECKCGPITVTISLPEKTMESIIQTLIWFLFRLGETTNTNINPLIHTIIQLLVFLSTYP